MYVKLATTNKRINSTLIPTKWRDVYVHLKEGTNIINPSFILSAGKTVEQINTEQGTTEDNAQIRSYNYVYVPAFKRYYYITNWQILDNDRLQMSTTEDVLASWKADIKASAHRFSRTPYKNDFIYDDTIPLSNKESVTKATTPLYSNPNTIAIYIDIAGRATASCNPTTSTYILPINALKELLAKVYDPTTYSSESAGTQVMDLLSQTICNPSQYIVGCRVGRVAVSGNTAPVIKFGWLDIPINNVKSVPDGVYNVSIDRTITFSNYANDLTKTYMLYIPCFGTVKLNQNDAMGTIHVKIDMDLHDGSAICQVFNGNGKMVHSATGAMLASMQVSGVVAKIPSITSAVGKAVTSAVTATTVALSSQSTGYDIARQDLLDMGVPLDAVETMTAPISTNQNAVSAISDKGTLANSLLEREVHTMGGSGSLAEILSQVDIIAYTITNARVHDKHDSGYTNDIIGTITESGYYRCSNTQLKTSALAGERESVVQMLQSGFYFE